MNTFSDHDADLPALISELQSELGAIKDRNNRVELDKAWEQSACRKVSLLLLTYAVASAVFYALGASAPLFSACIPTLGYLISTFSLPAIKRIWVRRRKGTPTRV